MEQGSHLILCVDDEVIGLQVRKLLLERAGYRVLTAQDGYKGLEVFETEPVEAGGSGLLHAWNAWRRGCREDAAG